MLLSFVGIVAGFVNGLFGSGAGMIILPTLISVFNMDDVKSRGTTIMSVLFLSIISSIFYFKSVGSLQIMWYVSVGGIVGGIIGAKLVKYIPRGILKISLSLFLIFSGIRILFY
ncbi:MAG: sulfite exporter TauE/SafE family protein [Clostridia bacterium]|nr:sulfite exporter TauE/SafE family protein [Clostridia bacterium]